jgi:hypothetical protein
MAVVNDNEALPESFALAFMLLPGFLSEGVVRYYSTSTPLSEIETIASALTFTLLNAAIAVAVLRLITRTPLRNATRSPGFIALVILVSLVTGAAWTVIDSRGWLFSIPLTDRTSRSDVWDNAMQQSVTLARRQVLVTLVDGRVYSGIVYMMSESDPAHTLFLRPAFTEVARSSSTGVAVERCAIVGGLLIPRAAIQLVAFRDPLKQQVAPCSDGDVAASLRGLPPATPASPARGQ